MMLFYLLLGYAQILLLLFLLTLYFLIQCIYMRFDQNRNSLNDSEMN